MIDQLAVHCKELKSFHSEQWSKVSIETYLTLFHECKTLKNVCLGPVINHIPDVDQWMDTNLAPIETFGCIFPIEPFFLRNICPLFANMKFLTLYGRAEIHCRAFFAPIAMSMPLLQHLTVEKCIFSSLDAVIDLMEHCPHLTTLCIPKLQYMKGAGLLIMDCYNVNNDSYYKFNDNMHAEFGTLFSALPNLRNLSLGYSYLSMTEKLRLLRDTYVDVDCAIAIEKQRHGVFICTNQI